MKRLLILLLLFSSFGLSADSNKSVTINNLEITVTGEYKVEAYKGANIHPGVNGMGRKAKIEI